MRTHQSINEVSYGHCNLPYGLPDKVRPRGFSARIRKTMSSLPIEAPRVLILLCRCGLQPKATSKAMYKRIDVWDWRVTTRRLDPSVIKPSCGLKPTPGCHTCLQEYDEAPLAVLQLWRKVALCHIGVGLPRLKLNRIAQLKATSWNVKGRSKLMICTSGFI